MSTFDYKSYVITVEQDVSKFFKDVETTRGIFSIWQSQDGKPGRQIYRGHTTKTFKSSEATEMVAASEDAARAWVDCNEGKPWA